MVGRGAVDREMGSNDIQEHSIAARSQRRASARRGTKKRGGVAMTAAALVGSAFSLLMIIGAGSSPGPETSMHSLVARWSRSGSG